MTVELQFAVTLVADPVRLAQVFANLLDDAAKYTERGGRISLKAEQSDDEVIVSVRDNGIGISAEMLPSCSTSSVSRPMLVTAPRAGSVSAWRSHAASCIFMAVRLKRAATVPAAEASSFSAFRSTRFLCARRAKVAHVSYTGSVAPDIGHR